MKTVIIGTGSFAPPRVVTNDDLAEIVDTSDEWIRTRTGIVQRRISEGLGTTWMAAEAAKRALEDAGVRPEEIDIIIAATTTADYCFPSTACEVQGILGAGNAVGYDVSAACSGFIFALHTMDALIKTGAYGTGLVIGADNLSKTVDWSDRSTCVLFGDGAGAAVVKACESGDRGVICSQLGSDGSKASVLTCQARSMGNFLTESRPEPGYIAMEGQEVFKFAVKKVPECVDSLLRDAGTDIDEVKYLVLHQANYRICESIARRLKISMDKIPMNIDRYGNTSGATIPILLDELNRQGKLCRGDKVVLAGFGAGLTWGSMLVQW